MTGKTMLLAEELTTGLPEMDGVEEDEAILAELAGDDPDGPVVWTDRLAAYDPGEFEAFDFDEAMPQLRTERCWT